MQKLTLVKRLAGLENFVNESRANSNLPTNFLFREANAAADQPKILVFESSSNVLIFGILLSVDF